MSGTFVAGHAGMVGSSIVKALAARGVKDILVAPRARLDLLDAHACADFFAKHRPELVIVAAARVGGINAHIERPAEFMYENLAIQNNLVHQAHVFGAKKVVLLGTSCVYPKDCPQPMKEEYLLTGPLEATTEPYALAKIAGLKLAQFYKRQYGLDCLNVMPCNLYGPGDISHPDASHVVASLVQRFADAADSNALEVTIWGTGRTGREFLHVDDLAEAVCFLLERFQLPDIINVGSGQDTSIKELATLIAEEAGFRGELRWDPTKPEGMLRKRLDVSRLTALGFRPRIPLREGIRETIAVYRKGMGPRP